MEIGLGGRLIRTVDLKRSLSYVIKRNVGLVDVGFYLHIVVELNVSFLLYFFCHDLNSFLYIGISII